MTIRIECSAEQQKIVVENEQFLIDGGLDRGIVGASSASLGSFCLLNLCAIELSKASVGKLPPVASLKGSLRSDLTFERFS